MRTLPLMCTTTIYNFRKPIPSHAKEFDKQNDIVNEEELTFCFSGCFPGEFNFITGIRLEFLSDDKHFFRENSSLIILTSDRDHVILHRYLYYV